MPQGCSLANIFGSAGESAAGSGAGGNSWIFLIVLVVAMFAIMIIPQRRRDKKVKDMLSALKVGDRVRTIGGIYGTISSIRDDVIVLLVGPDKVKIVFARGAIAQVEEAGVENAAIEDIRQ